MTMFSVSNGARFLIAASAWALSILVTGHAVAAPPKVQESELMASGFKILVATTPVQREWVSRLPAGQIRPMQRTGKKFFIFPDKPNHQIYIGGPKEYEAYRQLHPETKLAAREEAKQGKASRLKQNEAMRKANARDLSDPFLGADWIDLGW